MKMAKEFVYWRKSKMKQIPGNLIFDKDNVVFTKQDFDSYASGYQMGGKTYVKKDEYYAKKFNNFFANLFKKAAKIKEDFAFAKSEISDLNVSEMESPRLDPKKYYRPIPGEFDYIVMVNFSVAGENYELSFQPSAESRKTEIDGLFR